ncbi:MAG: hypothetical protein AB1696_27380 [Planctomycetota bacterium]
MGRCQCDNLFLMACIACALGMPVGGGRAGAQDNRGAEAAMRAALAAQQHTIYGNYASRSAAWGAVSKEAREKKCAVESVSLVGQLCGVQGGYRFAGNGELAMCSLRCPGVKTDAEAEAEARSLARKLGVSPSVITLSTDRGTKNFDADGKVQTFLLPKLAHDRPDVTISNRSGGTLLVKVITELRIEKVATIRDGENLVVRLMENVVKIRRGAPGNYEYWKESIPGNTYALILKSGAIPPEQQITQEEFGDETVSGGGAGAGTGGSRSAEPPDQVTVVLPNGARFKGQIVFEDETRIKIRSPGAELEWNKKQIKEIIRPKTDPPAP